MRRNQSPSPLPPKPSARTIKAPQVRVCRNTNRTRKSQRTKQKDHRLLRRLPTAAISSTAAGRNRPKRHQSSLGAMPTTNMLNLAVNTKLIKHQKSPLALARTTQTKRTRTTARRRATNHRRQRTAKRRRKRRRSSLGDMLTMSTRREAAIDRISTRHRRWCRHENHTQTAGIARRTATIHKTAKTKIDSSG